MENNKTFDSVLFFLYEIVVLALTVDEVFDESRVFCVLLLSTLISTECVNFNLV